MNYMVIEAHTSFAVVLDESGIFQVAANLNYTVGQTVRDAEILNTGAAPRAMPKRAIAKRAVAVVAAAAACLMLFFGMNMLNRPAIYGSVYMSINPDLRLDLNHQREVLAAVALNKDGERLLEGLEIEGQPIDDATARLTQAAIDTGYLKDGGAVTLEIEAEDKQWTDEMQQQLQTSVSAEIEGKVAANVNVLGKSPIGSSDMPTQLVGDAIDTPQTTEPEPTPSVEAIMPGQVENELTDNMHTPQSPEVTKQPEATRKPQHTTKPTSVATPKATETPTPAPTIEPVLPIVTDGKPTAQPSQPPRQTATPAPTEPVQTEAPTPIPIPTPTPTPRPTETPIPTSTPTPRPTQTPRPTHTPRPTVRPTPTPTPEPTRKPNHTGNGDGADSQSK